MKSGIYYFLMLVAFATCCKCLYSNNSLHFFFLGIALFAIFKIFLFLYVKEEMKEKIEEINKKLREKTKENLDAISEIVPIIMKNTIEEHIGKEVIDGIRIKYKSNPEGRIEEMIIEVIRCPSK